MKFNKNNSQKSVTFFSFLSFCAIITSTATIHIEPLSRNKAFTQTTIQQSEQQERQKPFEPPILGRSNDETLEEIELDQEWEDILSDDQSEGEMLLASTHSF
ncbi:MAG: hypothetical protein ACRC06_17445 [Waterburya sp.]